MQISDLGQAEYQPVCEAMRAFTHNRDDATEDALWLVEHPAVFTQGYNGHAEHLLIDTEIPVIQSDRGGQVTYHGPGQLVAYTLIDLRRRQIGVREMVSRLENTIISMLASYNIEAVARREAPGVYVEQAKIASLGLRVRRGACYHGVSLNVAMDLTPFSYINPCGYPGMAVTDLQSLGEILTMAEAKQQFIAAFAEQMQTG